MSMDLSRAAAAAAKMQVEWKASAPPGWLVEVTVDTMPSGESGMYCFVQDAHGEVRDHWVTLSRTADEELDVDVLRSAVLSACDFLAAALS